MSHTKRHKHRDSPEHRPTHKHGLPHTWPRASQQRAPGDSRTHKLTQSTRIYTQTWTHTGDAQTHSSVHTNMATTHRHSFTITHSTQTQPYTLTITHAHKQNPSQYPYAGARAEGAHTREITTSLPPQHPPPRGSELSRSGWGAGWLVSPASQVQVPGHSHVCGGLHVVVCVDLCVRVESHTPVSWVCACECSCSRCVPPRWAARGGACCSPGQPRCPTVQEWGRAGGGGAGEDEDWQGAGSLADNETLRDGDQSIPVSM